MEVRNNYNETLTNIACSIRKYFGLNYKHNTLKLIDKYLESKPKNVVLFLFDGMGSKIIDNLLDKDDFFIKNRVKDITTVYPATTVAAVTTIKTGLNPVETGMIGWNIYYKDIDKIITPFRDYEKGYKENGPLKEAIEYKNKNMKTKTIVEEINEKDIYKGYAVEPFGGDGYKDLDDMLKRVSTICNSDDTRKFLYVYDQEPDHTMHKKKCDSKEVKEIIKQRNNKVEELCKKLKDTLVIVIADHGHINVENIKLKDYPDIIDCMAKNTSIDQRAVNFFIKKGKKEEFKKIFNKYFKNDFTLYTKKDVIDSKLFGDGEENKIFKDELGDYLAVANTNKTLISFGDDEKLSHHAGYTDDEIFIPLIIKRID